METADMVSINTPIPQSWGTFLKLGDTPRPPAGNILHLFFGGLYAIKSKLFLQLCFFSLYNADDILYNFARLL